MMNDQEQRKDFSHLLPSKFLARYSILPMLALRPSLDVWVVAYLGFWVLGCRCSVVG
jgi:hypothetical protein